MMSEQEVDISNTPKGKKYDFGKPDTTLLLDFSEALKEVCRVGEFGCEKYDRGNWKYVEDGIRRYTAALLRHTIEDDDATNYNITDDESGFLHASHAAWCALARLELILQKEKNYE